MDLKVFYHGIISAMWILPFFLPYTALAFSCNRTLEEVQSLNKNCKSLDVPGVDKNLKEMVK